MIDTSTLIIYRAKDGYLFRLICPENKKIVGAAVKSYPNKEQVVDALLKIKAMMKYFEIYKDNRGRYRFRIFIPDIMSGGSVGILLRSESYIQKQNAEAGLESCRRAIEVGLVSCIACENTDIISLDDMPQAAVDRNWFYEES